MGWLQDFKYRHRYKKDARYAHPDHKIIDITWDELAKDRSNIRPILCKNDEEKKHVLDFFEEHGFLDIDDGRRAIGRDGLMVVKFRSILANFDQSWCIKTEDMCVWYRIVELQQPIIEVDDLL